MSQMISKRKLFLFLIDQMILIFSMLLISRESIESKKGNYIDAVMKNLIKELEAQMPFIGQLMTLV